MLKRLLEKQRSSLHHFWDHFDLQSAESFLKNCLECKGMIVLSGVGKSGLIAEKIAATLISTGTRALALSPVNFLHGDLGILGSDDVLILISKSGESEELLQLIPFVKRRKTKLLALVSHAKSRLARAADHTLVLPLDRELCPFDLAPTTSTLLQLLFGELLAVALMETKEFSKNEFGFNHPSGAIGKRLTLKVDDLMLKEQKLPLCMGKDLLQDVLVELTRKGCGCLIVVSGSGELEGIFTDGDLRRSLQLFGSKVLEEKISSLMTLSPLFVSRDGLVVEAMKLMQKDPKKWVMTLPVLEEKRVVGLLRLHDIIHSGI
ncbi:MAG: Gut Q protein [Chlamydiae bacterium GWC2_50_10]|nr:MAG: Gut Q protein [Chlamydiae bacterium GWA2_50_15]OGN53912.1 MAG: Gut Q protein [Chlamydiae bacterium GWC2_50_10]OGN64623.1 MAG: Gut Q protein [Chlamydiae bacterium RIFCSPHIGHO2_12_FULL_49_32]OGN68033.1 MAG: Gut Q protein [Chlamydiae bacterium RIFCSPLOWO2_02_FULL_49_12]OGN70577.1 MAG: Gut Q protein [Chlamydiae bacterium RIFCSPLOWO2_12_FULL_49_12]HAZ16215.1 KpsF/GutQ family sugar-phosphate isomerase [Parachlamydiales bacterium]